MEVCPCRSKNSSEEKVHAVMESSDHNTTQAEICIRYGIFPSQMSNRKQQSLEGEKGAVSRNRKANEKEEEIENFKRIIWEQFLLTGTFNKRLQGSIK